MPAQKGPNPVTHLMSRQMGDNILSFRKNLFRERLSVAKNLYRKDLVSHFGCVNAIEFSKEGELLISGGDDRRVLLWPLESAIAGIAEPRAMEKQHQSNIFCLSFNSDNTRIFSGGNDDTVIVHDVKTGEAFDVFLHAKPVYGLSVDFTNDQIFSTAGEDGRVLVFDLRQGTEVMSLAKYRAPFHAVQFHPLDGNFVITANGKEGAAFWDLRHTKMPALRYGGEDAAQSCMSVRFNTLGTQVLALRRRLPPILYNTCSQASICQFYHPDYYNSCTMKSCCFAGDDDEFVLSGSDDFNLYVWRVHDSDCNQTNQWVDTHQMVLSGHRSIVNQVRFNPQKCIIASSGVEKIVKLWHPFDSEGWKGSLLEEGAGTELPRDVFSHDEYVSLVNSSGQNMTHDYSNQNTTEDPRMMAFFDSLVQREIEGWNSNDNSASDKSSQHSSDGSSRPTSTESSDSESMSNYVTSNGNCIEPCRRRRIAMKPRTIYPNRIAYLIATKRNTLKRLALKGAASTERRVKSSKISSRNLGRSSIRISRKACGKRSGRLNLRNRSRDDNSDSEVPKKSTKRRVQQHLNTSSYRSFRRKVKMMPLNNLSYDSADSSSDADGATSTPHTKVYPSTSKSTNTNSEHKKYLFGHGSTPAILTAPLSSDNDNDNDDNDDDDDTYGDNNNSGPSTSNYTTNLAVPSTSTGITSNGMFRVPPQPLDSDDDQSFENSPSESPVNLVRVVPLPINGKHKEEKQEQPYSSGLEDEPVEENHNQHHLVRRKRNHTRLHDGFSSQSNSRLSSSSQDMYASSSDSLTSFFKNKKRKTSTNNGSTTTMVEITQNNLDAEDGPLTKTPNASHSRIMQNLTPDSGIATAACSSSGSAACSSSGSATHHDGNNNNKNDNLKENGPSTDATAVTLFQQKVARIRRNYRNNFGDDSDSD